MITMLCALSSCTTLDNGCEMSCEGCDKVAIDCKMSGEKTSGPGML